MTKILVNETSEEIALLNRPGKKVKNPQATEIIFLIQDMEKICIQNGVAGIAATQLGKPYRLFMTNLVKGEIPELYINPKIMNSSEKTISDVEGCLSVPGKHGMVERATQVLMRYQDRNLNVRFVNSSSIFEARCWQHECDHLDGILYVSHSDEIYDNADMEAKFNLAKQKEVDFNV